MLLRRRNDVERTSKQQVCQNLVELFRTISSISTKISIYFDLRFDVKLTSIRPAISHWDLIQNMEPYLSFAFVSRLSDVRLLPIPIKRICCGNFFKTWLKSCVVLCGGVSRLRASCVFPQLLYQWL